MGFAHLHLHTEYSLLDGANALDPLAREAAEKKLPALAITDHGNLYGALRFHEACLKHEIAPILGCEFYVAPGDRRDRSQGRQSEKYHHLILLARNQEGWQNLKRLSTASFREGFYYKPRIDKELLRQASGGLICLSACLAGEIPSLISNGKIQEAKAAAIWYRDLFGEDQYFLELQDHGIPEQKIVNNTLLEFSKDLGIQPLATNDSHYLRAEDAHAHDVLLCIGTSSHVDEPDRLKFEGDQFYLKDADEMRRQFNDVPQALENTLKVAEMCRFELPRSKTLMPGFDVPPGEDQSSFLRKEVERGMKQRYPEAGQQVLERMERELGVIEKAGFPGYFLVVADFVRYAHEQGIPVGPGRGSAAGSLVSYCLGITDLDPLHYGLLFERFLNPERLQPPDIDIDFADQGRDQVIEYVQKKYGYDHVAQVITFGTLGARAAIRDTGRAMNYSYGEVDALARLIPHELNITLEAAREENKDLKEKLRDSKMKRLWDVALRLEGLARHSSTHAAGVVISPEPLEEIVPLCLAKSGERDTENTPPVMMTQWDMASLEKAGLIKMDFLGLRTLTVIDETLKRLKAAGEVFAGWKSVPMDDAATYQMLARGDSHGVFQLESAGMKDLLRRFKPSHEQDLNALIALYRPGPMKMIDEFLQRRQGLRPVTYPLPQLEPILKETWGTILYQEQVMQIAVVVGGFSLAQADLLRRAMSKKKVDLLEEQRGIFLQGAARQGIKHGPAEIVFDLMARFAEYGFNKSHSAAYAMLAFRTAWLKRSHPAAFMAALMSSEAGNTERLPLHLAECKKFALTVLPPDVNASAADFTARAGQIRFGLVGIKNVGWAATEAIAENRSEGYRSLKDFIARMDSQHLNARALESMIKAGALDSLEADANRAQLLADLPLALESAQQIQRDRQSGQGSLFGETNDGLGASLERQEKVLAWPESTRLTFEKEVLGCYVSGQPLARWEALLGALRTHPVVSLHSMADGSKCLLGGMVSKVKPLMTRRHEAMYRVQLDDLESSVEVMIWPKLAQRLDGPVKEESLLLVMGRIDRGGDRLQISGERCLPLERAWSALCALHLELEEGDDEGIEKLKDLVSREPGPLPVLLHWKKKNGWVTQKLGNKFGVAKSEKLFETARGLWGNSFWLEV